MSVRAVIGICTDSGSQLPPALVERFAAAGVPVAIVPLTITIDDVDHLDGVDVCADRLTLAAAASLTVTSPSSGQMAGAYDDLIARGCTAIISIHAGGDVAGTANAARLAARSLDVPVKVIDAGSIGVGVGGCVWAVAEALIVGASLDEAALVAEAVVPTLMCAVGAIDDVRDQALRAVAAGGRVRLGVGHSDDASAALADTLADEVYQAAGRSGTIVLDIVRFRLGPSAGVYAVPGVFAYVMLPVT